MSGFLTIPFALLLAALKWYARMKRLGLALVGAVVMLGCLNATAVPFVSGDFYSDNGWIDASYAGSVVIDGGVATLSTEMGTSSIPGAVLVQGDDGFFNFVDPVSLASNLLSFSFDVRFSDLGVDSFEGDFSSFDDYLVVALYDAADSAFDRLFISGLDFVLSDSWVTYTFDITSLAGRDIALSFELNDEANGRDLLVQIDNVKFNNDEPPPVEVPEPQAGWLILLGLGGLLMRRRGVRT